MASRTEDVIRVDEFVLVKEFLEQSSGQQIRVTSDLAGKVLTMHGINCELSVRRDHDTLAVTKIEMPMQRRGQGTRVFELLKAYALSQGLKHLTVEHTTSHGIIAFCRKHGFKPLLIGCMDIEHGEVLGNYGLDL